MEVPKDIQARLTQLGGKNRFDEPNYRIVWGPSRLHWIGGKFEAAEFGLAHIGTHLAPKYGSDQWVLERWMSPEFYGGKEEWKRAFTKRIDGVEIDVLGPYPSRGDYEEVTSFDPLPLTCRFVEYMHDVVERSRNFSHWERRAAILAREEKKDKDWDSYADDVLDDAFSPFPAAHVALSDRRSR